MNILFVSSQFPNSLEPNKGMFSLQIVREMLQLADIKAISPVPSLGILKFLNPIKKYKVKSDIPFFEKIDNIPVFYPEYIAIPKMGLFHPIAMYKVLSPLIERIHKEWRIDAVNCHWLFPDGIATQKVCEHFGIPILLTALGCDLNHYVNFRSRKNLIKKALLRSGKVSVLNRSMHRRCIDLGVAPERLTIIPNGVDLKRFIILDRILVRKRLNLSKNCKIILFVGSLVPVKGIDSLLKAFALLVNDYKTSLRLYIIGSGFLGKYLKNLSIDLGVKSYVEFLGSINQSELVYWYNAADCLCLPSVREGHPNVMMEAFACGTPVVASEVGAIPDFVNSLNGYLTLPRDFRDIYLKIKECLSMEYDREEIRNTIKDYSWEECAKQYLREIANIA